MTKPDTIRRQKRKKHSLYLSKSNKSDGSETELTNEAGWNSRISLPQREHFEHDFQVKSNSITLFRITLRIYHQREKSNDCTPQRCESKSLHSKDITRLKDYWDVAAGFISEANIFPKRVFYLL